MKQNNKMQNNMKEFLDDATITAKVKAKFAADSIVKALKVHVTTENGVVTLTGNVSDQKAADKIEKLASSIQEVQDVVNNIEIE